MRNLFPFLLLLVGCAPGLSSLAIGTCSDADYDPSDFESTCIDRDGNVPLDVLPGEVDSALVELYAEGSHAGTWEVTATASSDAGPVATVVSPNPVTVDGEAVFVEVELTIPNDACGSVMLQVTSMNVDKRDVMGLGSRSFAVVDTNGDRLACP
jgi:hypothetical protein